MQKQQYTRLDVIGGSGGRATVETIVNVPQTPTHTNIKPGDVAGNVVHIKAEDMPPLPIFDTPIFDGPKKPRKVKVLTKYGRITIQDPALSDTLILQVTDGQCCVRPTEQESEYLKKIAAILRRELGA